MNTQLSRPEPLLEEGNKRYVMFPIQHPDIWQFYKNHNATLWTAEELDFTEDRTQFITLDENSKYFISRVLGFFAASDK